jgi:integrating conjugative element protein (TIGR03755 family)
MMTNFYRIVLVLLLVVSSQATQAVPEVSVDVGRVYYLIGGGKVLPPPGSEIYTANIRASFNLGYGYSCGRFSYHANVSAMVNDFMNQMREMPGQLVDAFSAAVAGFPSYLLMKANASLYNTVTKTLSDAHELFRFSYKSCEQIESELRQNPDSNPYQGFIRASILDRWHIGAENGENISDVHDDVKENPVGPITWFGGNEAGTVDNPIQVNRDFVVAGYNIMIGRSGDVSVTNAPTGTAAQQPIVQIWPTPEDARRWVQEVLGDYSLNLTDSVAGGAPESKPGRGIRPMVTSLEIEIHNALMQVYEHNDYSLVNNYLSLPSISGRLADGLRTLPENEKSVFIDRLVSEMSVKEIQDRMVLIRQMIYSALKHPDLLASPAAGGAAVDILYKKTLPSIRDVISEVDNEIKLQQKTINPTILSILDRAEEIRKSGHGKQSGRSLHEQRVE